MIVIVVLPVAERTSHVHEWSKGNNIHEEPRLTSGYLNIFSFESGCKSSSPVCLLVDGRDSYRDFSPPSSGCSSYE